MLTVNTLQFQPNTIPGMLRQRALDFPDSPCYLFPELGQTCTWRFLWKEVQAIATGLHRLGVQKSDRVAILMEGCTEQIICIYAALTVGAVAVPLSTYLTKEELKECFCEAKPSVFIMGSAEHHIAHTQLHDAVLAASGAEAVSETCWIPRHAFVQGSFAEPGLPFRPLEALRAAVDCRDLPAFSTPPLTVHDPAFLLFSSGTTGNPKAILRSTASFMAQEPSDLNRTRNAFKSVLLRWGNSYINRFCALSLLPLYHLAGIGLLLTPLQVCNVQMAMLTRFNPIRGLQAIAQTQARFLIGTPHMVQAMLTLKNTAQPSLESVLGVIFASAALLPHVMEQTIQSFKNLYFFSVSYGSTETGSVATGTCFVNNQRQVAVSLLLRIMRRMNYLDGEIPMEAFANTPASIGGTVSRQVEVGIRSPQTGAWLLPGQEGEIMVRSHRLMRYQDETNNQAHFADGGWFKTGDLGYVDAHNRIMITDRLKRIISRGGEKIAPAEIERLMKQQPGLEEALVLGIPDALYGEIVVAAFTEKYEGAVSVVALREALQVSLSSFKVPQRFLRLEELPLTASGKIAVAQIRNEFLHTTTADYA